MGVFWFLVKVFVLMFGYVWLRGTLPRTRYDQLMALGWKVLIPLQIVWILLIATIRVGQVQGLTPVIIVIGLLVFALIFLLVIFWDNAGVKWSARVGPQDPVTPETQAQLAEETGNPTRFPVPPLDLPHYHGISAETGPALETASQKEVTGAGN
jgi:NADH-quinone oxidoreductase subunit H